MRPFSARESPPAATLLLSEKNGRITFDGNTLREACHVQERRRSHFYREFPGRGKILRPVSGRNTD